jgi:drug/metabolite transporter (DMT)-like permease
MNLSARAAGLLLVAASALGFSTLAIFGKAAYAAGGNPVTVLSIRFLTASALFWIYLLLIRRPLPDRPVLIRLFLMGGIGYTAMSLLFLSAVDQDRISPALASLLLYTYPAIVTLLAWRFDGDPLTVRKAAALAGALAGTAIVLLGAGPTAGPAGARWTGVLLALGASAVYSCYIIVGNRMVRKADPLVVSAVVCTAAAVVFTVGGLMLGLLVPMAPAGWAASFGMALFATVLAVLCFFMGLERLGAAPASIISTLEPVGTVALSALFFGEGLTLLQTAGGAAVLASIILLQYRS